MGKIKGYKGMNKDMKCRGFQYEIGKTYHVDGKIELCRNGLHFCRNLIDVFDFYDCDGENRFFEVETTAPVYGDGVKSVSSQLTVIRELSVAEVNRARYGGGDGNGNGYGYGGDGYGYGYYGYGYGNGYGYGYGDGYGDGYGYGNGKNIQRVLVFK